MGCEKELIELPSEKDLIECLEKQKYPERQGILGSIDQTSRSAVIAALGRSTILAQEKMDIITEELRR